jgi:hypothetical protein
MWGPLTTLTRELLQRLNNYENNNFTASWWVRAALLLFILEGIGIEATPLTSSAIIFLTVHLRCITVIHTQ